VVPRGDDAAVVQFGSEQVVLTTDSVIEGRHFSLAYFSPEQVGAKAVEAAASDIIAMGARPQYVLWSLMFGEKRSPEFYAALARGVERSCARMKMVLVGGNVTQGSGGLELSMTVVGSIPDKRQPVLRSGARVGEVVMLTGMVGASECGRIALQGGLEFPDLARAHLEPRCRFDLIDKIGPHASSMIDVSDGLSSELHHLSRESQVKLIIDESKIPVHQEVRRFATHTGADPLSYVYSGGEEYQLLFTTSAERAERLPAALIGTVESGAGVAARNTNGEERVLADSGYDHLR
jgi:thiamine-monophosphate kinase